MIVFIASIRDRPRWRQNHFAGMPMPLKVEALAADPVETRERRVKLVAEVLGKAGPIACSAWIHCRCRMITPSRRDSVEFWIVPVPRQELIEFARRLISNAGENVSQPSLRIDVVELGGLDQRVHDRGALSPAL
jgi:hypothetical protein